MTIVFIGGSRRLGKLAAPVKERIDKIINNGFTILIGDANGTDRCVQDYLASKHYRNVIVFCMEGVCRNNIGDWDTKGIEASGTGKDFNYYSTKDLQMAKEASYGFMIWDAKSNGTLNNIINLLKRDKKILVYFSPDKAFHKLRGFQDLSGLLAKCDRKELERFEKKFGISRLLNSEQPELTFA